MYAKFHEIKPNMLKNQNNEKKLSGCTPLLLNMAVKTEMNKGKVKTE